jgi:hypothetical protein
MKIYKLPKIWNYYNYSSENYGVNAMAMSIGPLILYFSYETVIGISYKGKEFYSENCWGMTTGKHLNQLCPDKKSRLLRIEFEQKLNQITSELFKEEKEQQILEFPIEQDIIDYYET